MKTWRTEKAIIRETAFDHDLHAFEVCNHAGKALGTIYPPDVDTMNEWAAALDAGHCPVAEAWEDGDGHTFYDDGLYA